MQIAENNINNDTMRFNVLSNGPPFMIDIKYPTKGPLLKTSNFIILFRDLVELLLLVDVKYTV